MKTAFTLALDVQHASTLAFLWVDSSGDGMLQPDELVPLFTADGKTWTGEQELNHTAGVPLLLRFKAPVGTSWEFSANDGTKNVFLRSGTTAVPIEIVAGTMS